MPIQVTCDSCYYSFSVGDRNAGKRGKCPECGDTVEVPAPRGRQSQRTSAGSSHATNSGRRTSVSNHGTGSQQKTLLIGGGIVAGVVILGLVIAVAYLAGRSDNQDEPADNATVAKNDDAVETPVAPIIPEPFTSQPGTTPALVETSTPTVTTPGGTSATTPSPTEPEPKSATDSRYASVADLIEAVEPSVCRIDVESSAGSSTGSGFVIDASGIIMTNYHVIEGALRASVTFPDHSTARVLGVVHLDAKKDIALIVIKPPTSSLMVARLATGLPRKGDVLVAIGAPLGLDFSASEGKVSAIRTEADLKKFGAEKKGTWIQSTAPISPGNSGGPLFNMSGEVVAANTMTITIGQNLNFGISAGDIAEAVEKRSEKLTALSPATVPAVAGRSSNGPGRGNAIDGTNTTRGRDLFASLSEVQLLVGTFSFDPTGKVENHIVRLAENTLKQAKLEQKQTNSALLAVFMKFDKRAGGSRAKSLVIEAHLIVRDRNQMVTVWKDSETVGSFSEASLIKGIIPSSVKTRIVKFFGGFRSGHRKAINERNKAAR
jgi:S1-C subfamily serine protease